MKWGGVLFTCEHASARVPKACAHLFSDRAARRRLSGHHGSDLGAKSLAASLCRHLRRVASVPVLGPINGRVSRLVVDLNRSPHHPRRFSDRTWALPEADRDRLFRRYYEPHQRTVREALHSLAGRRPVLHLAVHSFAPVLRGVRRAADVGLLYDPARAGEREFADLLHERLRNFAPTLRVRRNYPYRGVADGLTTALRRELPERSYVGFELEFNQGTLARAGFATSIAAALEHAVTAS